MSQSQGLNSERQVLREALRDLQAAVGQETERTRNDAISEANRRLRAMKRRPLPPTTVGDWFTKGTPASTFEALWALVSVLLEWTGHPSAESYAREDPQRARAKAWWQGARELWKARWKQAKEAADETPNPAYHPLLEAYCRAAREAQQHPYVGPRDDTPLPELADVYVRQQVRHQAPAASQLRGAVEGARSALPDTAVPANEVFQSELHCSVLLAGAGAGKSTLLNAHRAASADRWLQGSRATAAVVLVNARDLAGTHHPLPGVLARSATAELRQYGLLHTLPDDLFHQQPRPGACWFVLVDGLDEIADAAARRAVLGMVKRVVAGQPDLYRFVIATRPLPGVELDILGPDVPRYELQPFTRSDLRTYAAKWFRGLDSPDRHADAFIAGLGRSRLDVLARTPLMASMLCHLYAADPARPLPDGRTGAYRAFVELIYETNIHKDIKSTHEQAIRNLQDRHQVPQDHRAAEQAARHVCDHLPELIDYLAHQRLDGDPQPAVAILASHPHAARPAKVTERLWQSFLSDLLRPTGLLIQRADDFDFPHQTFLEYHAARYATRNDPVRAQALVDLRRRSRVEGTLRWMPPNLDPSFLGFLLDGLLSPQDNVAAETRKYLEELTSGGDGPEAWATCVFLAGQVELRTNLPLDLTADRLTALAGKSSSFMRAAEALSLLEGHRDEGAAHLAAFATDTRLGMDRRVAAALSLAGVEGHRDEGAAHLAAFATDTSRSSRSRVHAAKALAGVENHRERGVAYLNAFVEDSTQSSHFRVGAAEALARVPGHRDDGAARLAAFIENTTLGGGFRTQAALGLAQLQEYRAEGIAFLNSFIKNTALDADFRVKAAQALAEVAGHRVDSVAHLSAFALNPQLNPRNRVQAARALAGVSGYRRDGVSLLRLLAQDTTLDGGYRVHAAGAITELAGYWGEGLSLLRLLVHDTTLGHPYRVRAALSLRGLDRSDGTALLHELAQDSSNRRGSTEAIRALIDMAGETEADWLHDQAQSATLDGDLRIRAAWRLTRMAGRLEDGAALLQALARDTSLGGDLRARAAWTLANVSEHPDEGVSALRSLVQDATLDERARLVAASIFARFDGDAGVAFMTGFAQDTTHDGAFRVRSALWLTQLTGHRDAGRALLSRLVQDPSLDDHTREWAAWVLTELAKETRA